MRWLRAARPARPGWTGASAPARCGRWSGITCTDCPLAAMRPPTWISFISIPPTCPRQVKPGWPPACAAAPDAPWEVVNQARVHLWRRDGERVPPPSHRWKPASPPGLKRRPASAFRWARRRLAHPVPARAVRPVCLDPAPQPGARRSGALRPTAARQALYREMAQVAPRGRARTEFMSALKYLTGYPPPARPGPQAHGPGPPGPARAVIRKARMACAPTASCMTTWST